MRFTYNNNRTFPLGKIKVRQLVMRNDSATGWPVYCHSACILPHKKYLLYITLLISPLSFLKRNNNSTQLCQAAPPKAKCPFIWGIQKDFMIQSAAENANGKITSSRAASCRWKAKVSRYSETQVIEAKPGKCRYHLRLHLHPRGR